MIKSKIAQIQDDLIEKLAELEHQQWCELMTYLFKYDYIKGDYGYIKGDKYQKTDWKDLIETSYNDLSEFDKDKDRKFARKVLPIINQGILTARDNFRKIINEFGSLRLYRSKSCQLLIRRLKEKIE